MCLIYSDYNKFLITFPSNCHGRNVNMKNEKHIRELRSNNEYECIYAVMNRRIQACTGLVLKPKTSAILAQRSTNWAIKPYFPDLVFTIA